MPVTTDDTIMIIVSSFLLNDNMNYHFIPIILKPSFETVLPNMFSIFFNFYFFKVVLGKILELFISNC